MLTRHTSQKDNIFSMAGRCLTTFLIVAFMSACAPVSHYAVNMTSDPVRNVLPAGDQIRGVPVTLAVFNDVRPVEDKNRIGTVTLGSGEKIPVISINLKPADMVTSGVKSYLSRAGYTVLTPSPSWDLKPSGISKYWGRILMGGKIETLDIRCEKSNLKASYRTQIRLSLILADVQKASIIHTYSVQGESSREDVNLTEDDLRKHLTIEINNAVTDAIQKLMDSRTIGPKIVETVGGKKP